MDASGAIYVTDTRNFTIRKLTPAGTNWVVTTILGQAGVSGSADGTNHDARFYYADGLAIDPDGNLIIADSSNHTIRYAMHQGTNWVVRTIAGLAGVSGDEDGTNWLAHFNFPHGVAIAGDGSLVVTDGSNYEIRHIKPVDTNWVVRTIAGSGGPEFRDGTNSAARFNHPWGIAHANSLELYISDENNHTLRRVAKTGTNWLVNTVAGLGRMPGSSDGTNTDARFRTPRGLAVAADGALYVSDHSNNIIRKVTFQGSNAIVTTIAGTAGLAGSADGTNSSALFNRPLGIAADRYGGLYVADNQAIRRLTADGTNWITRTLAGLAGAWGYLDGTNGNARFNAPCGIGVDSATNIYVADFGNNVIRKVTSVGTNWVVTTIAGSNISAGSRDGTNSGARFWNPYGIAVDDGGVVFVADSENHSIRKITPSGTNWVVTTIGGLGTIIGLPDFQGNSDGVGSDARFASPTALMVSSDGTVFVADYLNNAIRQGTPLLPVLGMPEVSAGAVHLSWTAITGQLYQLQSSADLTSSNWINVDGAVSSMNGAASADDNISGSAQRFYRVLLLP
jgi:sugar lactone lactonase YvrE